MGAVSHRAHVRAAGRGAARSGRRRVMGRCALVAALTLLGAAGALAQPQPKFSGFLAEYSQLELRKQPDLYYNYAYLRPGVDWGKYKGVLIDEVKVYMRRGGD